MEHRYPGKEPSSPEQEQINRQEILASLGDNFNVCWDTWEESGRSGTDKLPSVFLNKKDKTFNEKVFFEAATKLKEPYLIYIQRLIQEKMDEIQDKQSHKKITVAEAKNEMVNLTIDFITKLEFFSRFEHGPEQITSGGKTAKQLETELTRANIQISEYAQGILRNKKEFIISEKPEQINLVRLKVKDLFPNETENPTAATEEIYEKAKEFGLELCSAEVGPAYRLAYTPNGELKKEQPMNEWVTVAMKQIIDSDGNPGVFYVERRENGMWLRSDQVSPTRDWGFGREFVFRLSK